MGKFLLLFACFSLLPACSWVVHKNSQQPRAVRGELDLSRWDFAKDGPIWLEGEWFYLDGLVDPQRFDPTALDKLPLQTLPGRNTQASAEKSFAAHTFILKLKLPVDGTNLSISSEKPYFPMRAASLGSDGKVRQLYQTDPDFIDDSITNWLMHPAMQNLQGLSETFYLVVHAKSFSMNSFSTTPVIGRSEDIQRRNVLHTSETFVLVGCYFIVAVYCFFLYWQRRSDTTQLLTGLATLGLLIRYLGSDQALCFLPYFDSLVFVGPAMICGFFCANMAIFSLLVSIFHPGTYRRLKKPLLALTLLVLSAWVTSDLNRFLLIYKYLATSTGIFFGGLAIFNNFYALWMSLKQRGSYLFLGLGSVLVTLSFVLDTLIVYNMIAFPYTSHYSNLFFCLAITLMISRNFAATYRENEKLLLDVQEKEKARTLFFHNTSHELRTPLNGIIGFMQLVLQGRYGALDKAVEQQIGKCLRLSLSLKNQVNTILDLAKSKKGQLTLSNSLISLDELGTEVDDLAAGLTLRKETSSFTFKKSWIPGRATFANDREKIGIVLRNLLGNAFKFADPQRPNQVSLSLERLDKSLRIEVKDTGIGIPEDQKDRVFEEFQQVSSDARRAYEGTGLGLAMVRDIVKLMGGSIELHSKLGAGSTFTVTIPEQQEIHLKQAESLIAGLPAMGTDSGIARANDRVTNHGAHILVVDDHELNCELLRDILQEEGYRVSTAFSGPEALQLMNNQHPDLLLLDMMMPQMSGEDVIKIMQADDALQDIPIILITARASEDDRLFGLSLGADDYLAKPIHHEELLFRVRNIIHRLETTHHVAVVEEREKLAQLGQLMRETSHELKNIFQMDQQDPASTRQTCEDILRRLPLQATAWPRALRFIAADEKINAAQVNMDLLSFTGKDQQTDRSLRYLRSVVAQLPMDDATRQELWVHVQTLGAETWQDCERSILFIRNHLALQEQTRYASELIINMLEYGRNYDEQTAADIAILLPRVLKLMQPKLNRHRVQVESSLKPLQVHLNPGHFLQVTLNLLINACEAVAELPQADRWIRILVEQNGRHASVRVENGGPPIPFEAVQGLFHSGESTKGSKGYGLGLGISQRLLMRVMGHLDYDATAEHPAFVIRVELHQGDAHAAKIA